MSVYEDSPEPNEFVTAYLCRGCEQLSLSGDLEPCNHPAESTGDQLKCPRCEVWVDAAGFYTYKVVEGDNDD